LSILQLCHNRPHSTHDLTLWWTPLQRLIIYCDLWNHSIMVRHNLSKIKKLVHVCIRFFIYDWTLTSMTLIYSHRIYNHVICNFMLVVVCTSYMSSYCLPLFFIPYFSIIIPSVYTKKVFLSMFTDGYMDEKLYW